MTTMNAEERERVRLIQERYKLALSDDNLAEVVDPYRQGFAVAQSAAKRDIDFLLSLRDSQAAGDTKSLLRRLKDFLFDNCNHNERDRNYDWCPLCVMAFMEVVSRPSDSDAATRMRDKCVEKVGQLRDKWEAEAQNPSADLKNLIGVRARAKVDAARAIITELTYVTLDSTEQKEEHES